jgi:hypothetical protein
METLTAATIATVLLTKMVEKLGEKAGEKLPDLGAKVWEQVENLRKKLRHNDKETAKAIELVTVWPELVEQQPEDYGLIVLTEKMELAAKDPEVAQIIEALAAEVRPQLSSKVRNIIGENITSEEGSIKFTGNEQDGSGSNDVSNKLGINVKAKGDISFGNNTQKG